MAAVRRGTPCPLCGEPKTSSGERPCRKCDRIGSRKPRPCEVCATTYTPTHSLQRACGRACGVILRRMDGVDPWPSSTVAWRRCAYCATWYTQRGRKRCGCKATSSYLTLAGSTKTVSCADCGCEVVYVVTGSGSRRLRCTECQGRRNADARRARKKKYGTNDRKRARAYGVEYEPIDRQKVYERDHWKCGLCGKRVLKNTRAPHPRSPSLDHVIPMSCGGPHTYANVQLACFLCNSLKGAGGSQQLALVG